MDVKIKNKAKPKILQKTLEEYYFQRMEEKAATSKFMQDDIHYAPATEMEIARNEIACLDNKLVKAREAWMEDKKELDTRWKYAVERYNETYENLPKFNGYYKDSFNKRERSIYTTDRERQQIEHKNREIRRFKKERDTLARVKDDANQRLEKFSVFKTYLEKVKEASQGEYEGVREIIDRYSVLSGARLNLKDQNETTRDTISKRQKALESDMLMKSNEVLAYRNYLSELLEYHTALQEQVQRLDDNLLRIKTTAAQRTLIIGQIKMAIQNLYFQVCKHMHRAAKIDANDVLGHLADIRISVREMSKLSKDIKHMLKAAFVAAEGEKAAREKAKRKSEERQKRMDKMNNRGQLDVRELFGLPPLILENSNIDFKKLLMNPNTKD